MLTGTDASLVTVNSDNERHGHWWSIKQGDAAMTSRLAGVLTCGSAHVARGTLTDFDDVTRALRASAGRAVIPTDRLDYQPEEPA